MTKSIIWKVTKTLVKSSTRAGQTNYVEVTLQDQNTDRRAQTLVSDTMRNRKQWQRVFDAVSQGYEVFIDNLEYKLNTDGTVAQSRNSFPLIDADSKPNIQSIKGSSRMTYNNLFE